MKMKPTNYKPGSTQYGSAKSPKMTEERKWKAESALRTLTEADRIRDDKSLMSDVRKCAAEQKQALEKVTK